MSNRPWMPLYVGDFIADTMHLSATETGIYLRLIMHCWQHGTIPREDRKLALISHCDTRLWHQYRDAVLCFFDVVDASTMQHKRVSTELRRCEEISNKRKAAAEQKRSKSDSLAEQLHTHSQSHLQREERKKELPADAGDDEKASRETFPPVQTESPSGLTTKYHFESGIIKLRERDFLSWEKAFSYLDLRAELIALTPWADREGANWFHAVSGALAKRNREQKTKVAAAKEHPHKWRSGIEGVV